MMIKTRLIIQSTLRISCLLVSLFTIPVLAQTTESTKTATPLHTDFGRYRIHHSVFNSSFLPSEAAAAYGFVRGNDNAIINIAVTDIDAGAKSLGLPVELKGSASNLLQQRTEFEFIAIEEGAATYYLAQFEFGDRDILNFVIHVLLPGERYSKTIKFSKTLYHD